MNNAQKKLILPLAIAFVIASLVLLAPVLPLDDTRAMNIPNRFAPPFFYDEYNLL